MKKSKKFKVRFKIFKNTKKNKINNSKKNWMKLKNQNDFRDLSKELEELKNGEGIMLQILLL